MPGGGHAELVMLIAQALAFPLAGAGMSLERLADEVGRVPTLLLLDNMEHRVADLPVLARRPRCRRASPAWARYMPSRRKARASRRR